MPGDYNGNGVVDGPDYVVWRNGGPLLNEVADARRRQPGGLYGMAFPFRQYGRQRAWQRRRAGTDRICIVARGR